MFSVNHAKVLESPGWKTFFATVIPIAIGILSGTFIVEISTPTGLDFTAFFRAKSFYGLVTMVLVAFFYSRAVYMYERDVERFLDEDYCRAYMRSKCLPEAAERYKQLIREGERGELVQAMEEFERTLR